MLIALLIVHQSCSTASSSAHSARPYHFINIEDWNTSQLGTAGDVIFRLLRILSDFPEDDAQLVPDD